MPSNASTHQITNNVQTINELMNNLNHFYQTMFQQIVSIMMLAIMNHLTIIFFLILLLITMKHIFMILDTSMKTIKMQSLTTYIKIENAIIFSSINEHL